MESKNFLNFVGRVLTCYWNYKPLTTGISKSGAWTVLPQSRVENDKDKQLHDMVQKYSSGEISREQYTRKYLARTEFWDYHLIFMLNI